jgi:predicted ATP-grasp superfamily ATP-dependent carboligase
LLVDHLKLGYSSQDWLICEDGCYVVDINPAGQWLFLPEPIASSVAEAIARWVGGGTR